MIFDNFVNNTLFEAEEYQDDLGQAPVNTESAPYDPPEFVHLKKYYLLEKLRSLRSRLIDNGLINNDLNIIINFGNNLSYNTLMSLTDAISKIIELQLQKLTQNIKDKDKSNVD